MFCPFFAYDGCLFTSSLSNIVLVSQYRKLYSTGGPDPNKVLIRRKKIS